MESIDRLKDHRFLHLVRWETRLLGLRRRSLAWLFAAIPILALATAGIWRAAIEPEPLSRSASQFHTLAMVCLLMTPLHDRVANLEQMKFGYICLRLITYLVVFWAWLLLPGIVGATVANDRRTGRMEEMRTTTFPRGAIYLAKAVAAARPFWMAGLFLFLLFSGVAMGEQVSLGVVTRLFWEMSSQIFLIALVAVTCSALCFTAAGGRAAAYFLLWIVLPCLWLAVLWCSRVTTDYPFFQAPDWSYELDNMTDGLFHSAYFLWKIGRVVREPWSYAQLCWAQVAFACTIDLIVACLGIWGMRPQRRRRFRRRSRSHSGTPFASGAS